MSRPVTSIEISREHSPQFPDRCVCCNGKPREGPFRTRTRTVLTTLSPALIFSATRPRVAVGPICDPCHHRWRRRWWLAAAIPLLPGMATMAATMIAVYSLVTPVLPGVLASFTVTFCGIVFFIATTSALEWCFRRLLADLRGPQPQPLLVIVHVDTLEYSFAAPEFARDFEELNREHIVSRNPDPCARQPDR